MAELPFPPDTDLQPEVPQAPQATGLRRVVIAVGVTVVCVGLAAIVLFGTRTAHKLGQRTATKPAEAMPRPAHTGDPLKGLQTDYAALLTKPQVQAVAPPPAQPPAQAAAPATPPVTPKPKEKQDQGMLILQGKRSAETPQILTQQMAQRPQTEEPQPQQQQHGPVERNRDFLKQATGLRETRVQDHLHTPESPHMVLAGDFIPAVLVQGINSGLPGELVARVSRDVRDSVVGNTVLIPQGAHLIGSYNNDIAYGQDRVLVVWHRLRFPNGQTIQLQGMPGIDLSGYSGLKDKVNNHLWPLFRAVILSSVLSIGARVPAGNPSNSYWQSLPQEFAQDFGSAANRAGQKIVERELQRPPTITVRPGMSFNVFVVKDLVLQPYTGAVAGRR